MAAVGELPIRTFVNQIAWESWLSAHHSSGGLWLKFSKKGAIAKSLTYQKALEVALCYGWIDSQKRSFDDQHFLQKFGPRGTRSIWSRINRSKAEQLIRDGRMQAAGLAAVDRAKQNGQWDKAYDSQKTIVPPNDFMKALKAKPAAKAFFDSLDSQNRYAVLFRIHTAKKVETRTNRIKSLLTCLIDMRSSIHST
jgi:uncharacterized protein YdeI (YjbR/CyaY-like superfamily)